MKKCVTLPVILFVATVATVSFFACMMNVNSFVDTSQEGVGGAVLAWALLFFLHFAWPIASVVFVAFAIALLRTQTAKKQYGLELALLIVSSVLLPVAAFSAVLSFGVALYSKILMTLTLAACLGYVAVLASTVVCLVKTKRRLNSST